MIETKLLQTSDALFPFLDFCQSCVRHSLDLDGALGDIKHSVRMIDL